MCERVSGAKVVHMKELRVCVCVKELFVKEFSLKGWRVKELHLKELCVTKSCVSSESAECSANGARHATPNAKCHT